MQKQQAKGARRAMKIQVGGAGLELMQGDITALAVDAIVNAANASLILGGGVAGAIRSRGGPRIQEECDRIGGTFVGGAVITTGGTLPARHVIHAVGPRWGEGDEHAKLRNAVANSLKVADRNRLASVAFPAISTGIFGFPLEPAARTMLSAALDYLHGDTALRRVIFCLFSTGDYQVFVTTLRELTDRG